MWNRESNRDLILSHIKNRVKEISWITKVRVMDSWLRDVFLEDRRKREELNDWRQFMISNKPTTPILHELSCEKDYWNGKEGLICISLSCHTFNVYYCVICWLYIALTLSLCRERIGIRIQLVIKQLELIMGPHIRWKFMKVLVGLDLWFVAKLCCSLYMLWFPLLKVSICFK